MEDNDYIAMTSLGGFIEGWTLVIPRAHIFSMLGLYNEKNLVQFVNQAIIKIKSKYNKRCIIFEHGANHEGSVVACGTNHAHLHILPYEKSLLEEMEKDDKVWVRCGINEIKSLVGDNEYWFYAEAVDDISIVKGYVHIVEESESQYFRRILAKLENCDEQYNYKEYHFREIAEATYDVMAEM